MNLKKGAEPNARKGNTSGRRVKIILVIILIPEGKMVKRNAIVRLNKNSLLNLYNMHKFRRLFLLLNAPRNPTWKAADSATRVEETEIRYGNPCEETAENSEIRIE